MHVVVVDAEAIAGEADFPQLNLKKFGWTQYPSTDQPDLGERCWRSDVIVSTQTPIDQATIDKAFKLKLIVVAGESIDHIDLNAAKARGISVSHTPGLDPANADHTKKLCRQVVTTINAFLKGNVINPVC